MSRLSPNLAQQFSALWDEGGSPPDVFAFLGRHPQAELRERLAVLLADQQHKRQSGIPTSVEEYCRRCPEIDTDPSLKLELVLDELSNRCARGETVQEHSVLERFPDLDPEALQIGLRRASSTHSQRIDSTENAGAGPAEFDDLQTRASVPRSNESPTVGAVKTTPGPDSRLPDVISRYRVIGVLGKGAFGQVCRARDDELKRDVAVKIPHRHRFRSSQDVAAYRTEAQNLARLDHPNIVPIYDVGQLEDGRLFVVSKFIDGADLRHSESVESMNFETIAELIADIAGALNHAHKAGLVHRDIKPENILLDKNGKAFLADFGIALTDDQASPQCSVAGTPSYMSPEQARGQANLVDGRSDIFSLGAVLYELLSGTKPFSGDTVNEIIGRITSTDVRPPRQRNDQIPMELERICLKAMSRDPTRRYCTASDMAKDLRTFLKGTTVDRPRKSMQLSARWGRLGCTVVVMALLLIAFVPQINFRKMAQITSNGRDAVDSMPSAPEPSAPIDNPPPAPPESFHLKLQSPKEMSPPTGVREELVERFEIRVFGVNKSGLSIEDVAARPVTVGDRLQFHVDLAVAGHAYLFWIDSQGRLTELYPGNALNGALPDNAITNLESPQGEDQGWPIAGKPGLSMALLLVKRDASTDYRRLVETALPSRRAVPPKTKPSSKVRDVVGWALSLARIAPHDPKEIVWYTVDRNRSPEPVVRSQNRKVDIHSRRRERAVIEMIDQLRDHFDEIRIVSMSQTT